MSSIIKNFLKGGQINVYPLHRFDEIQKPLLSGADYLKEPRTVKSVFIRSLPKEDYS